GVRESDRPVPDLTVDVVLDDAAAAEAVGGAAGASSEHGGGVEPLQLEGDALVRVAGAGPEHHRDGVDVRVWLRDTLDREGPVLHDGRRIADPDAVLPVEVDAGDLDAGGGAAGGGEAGRASVGGTVEAVP